MAVSKEFFGGWSKVIPEQELKLLHPRLVKLYTERTVNPSFNNIFRAFRETDYSNLKVIMLGQDPYPQRGVATGLAFANESDTVTLSPSLEVIEDALFGDETELMFWDPSLLGWAKQGVLLLNSALTVEVERIGSHTTMWRPFISKLLTNLSEINSGIIYVLWGKQAESFESFINKDNNYIIKNPHPAYYARKDERMDNSVFIKINTILHENHGVKSKINWYE